MLVIILNIFILCFFLFGPNIGFLNGNVLKSLWSPLGFRRGKRLEKLLSNTNCLAEKLPQYKFYTELVHELHRLSKALGTPVRKPLMALRSRLLKDVRFEKKLFDQVATGLLQMLFVPFLILLFGVAANSMLSIQIGTGYFKFIAFIQILGILLFSVTIAVAKSRLFSDYDLLIRALFSLEALSSVSLPFSRLSKLANLGALDKLKRKRVVQFRESLLGAIERSRSSGASLQEELLMLKEEAIQSQTDDFARFLSFCKASKFVVMGLFFVRSYLIYVYALFQSFFH